MEDPDILANAKAIAIINKAKAELLAIGVPSLISLTELPHGMSLSLHVATSQFAVCAACVALSEGVAEAHTESVREEFEERVASFAAGSAIFAASYDVPK